MSNTVIAPITKATWDKHLMSITSGYGWRWFFNFHRGVDIAPAIFAYGDIPIIAQWDGVVMNKEDQNKALFTDLYSDDGRLYRNVHLKKFLLPSGSKVKLGDEIGLMGSTGNSTGTHTHMEPWRDQIDSGSHFNPNLIFIEDFVDDIEKLKKQVSDLRDWRKDSNKKHKFYSDSISALKEEDARLAKRIKKHNH